MINSAAKMQHQEQLKKQVGVLQQRLVHAETKLVKQEELFGGTERNIEELDDSIADLRKRILSSPRVSPRQQSVDEEMFSAKEDQERESGDDPARGLGRRFKVVKPKKNKKFKKPGKAMLLEKELAKEARSILRSQFLRIHVKFPEILKGPRLKRICVLLHKLYSRKFLLHCWTMRCRRLSMIFSGMI